MKTPFRIIIYIFLANIFLLLSGCSAESNGQTDPEARFAKARKWMIDSQLINRGITDKRLLAAFEKVARHRFVPGQYRDQSYGDHPLPIGMDQTISQPYIVAIMTQLLDLDTSDIALEVGTGSGYQAAILGELAKEVYTIEIIERLGKKAESLLDTLGYENVFVRIGDGYKGWPEKAPFDGIIVTCAPPEIPQPLIEQLADSGRMVIPVGTYYQELILLENINGKISETKVLPVRFVPMTGEAQEKK